MLHLACRSCEERLIGQFFVPFDSGNRQLRDGSFGVSQIAVTVPTRPKSWSMRVQLLRLLFILAVVGCQPQEEAKTISTSSPNATATAKLSSSRPNPYAPCAVGDYWKYSISTGGHMVREVLREVQTPNETAFQTVETDLGYKSISLYKFDEQGRFFRVRTENSDDGTYYTFEPPYTAMGVVEEGASWSTLVKTVRHQPGAPDQIVSEIEIGSTVLQKEEIKVPAGSFETFVLKSKEDPTDRTWIAKGVGMVRYEAELDGEPIVYELVDYMVK